MPWNTATPMEQRHRFVVLAEAGDRSISELCELFGISRKTGHKWLKRFRHSGQAGLADQSRIPKSSPGKTPEKLERLIVAEKRRRPTWGPKKIRKLLETRHGIENPPATSTVGEVLKRNGLVTRRRRRPGVYQVERGDLTEAKRNNEVWAVDYKGWFMLGDGSRCDPLTISDLHSRFVIALRANPMSTVAVTRRGFESAFRRYGLPEIIRVDNGSPFSSMGPGGLSRLSVWWLTLGIEVEFTRPGCPQDNGCHERMHRTLKEECCHPASVNRAAQQKRMDRWRGRFNDECPHESLGMRTPGEVYELSGRRLSTAKSERLYEADQETVPVSENGAIWLEGRRVYVGEAFVGHSVALDREIRKGVILVRFANVKLGEIPTGTREWSLEPVG